MSLMDPMAYTVFHHPYPLHLLNLWVRSKMYLSGLSRISRISINVYHTFKIFKML